MALKGLPAELSADEDRMRRFVQEAKATAALNRPHLAHVYEIGQAKILDFGLAKLITPPQGLGGEGGGSSEVATAIFQQHSTPGTVIGTVGYMSREQAQGMVDRVDHGSDIFSFGCILFEAVTGHMAFAGKDSIETLNKVIREPAPAIGEFRPDLPNHLQRIVRRCLQKDPERRYQSIKDVAIELEELQQELKGEAEWGRIIQPEARSEASASDNARSATGATQTSAASDAAPAEARPAISTEYLVSEIKRHRLSVAIALTALVVAIAGVALLLYKFVGQNRVKSAVPF